MIETSCHCGAVTLALAAPPETVTDCNCSICRRYGVLWAYYPQQQVRVSLADGGTDVYQWGDRSIAFHRCRACGCVTHWAPVTRGVDRMGVNARLIAPDILENVRVRKLGGADSEKYVDE